MAKETHIYQLKITLKGSRPPIWRRVLVPSDVKLNKLHDIVQTVMGWYNCHLHNFEVGGILYATPHPDDWEPVQDERKVKLQQVLFQEKTKILYVYDFGDNWEHEVLLEKIVTTEPGADDLLCVKGKRACPPEDCGGIWGYVDFLETIHDPDHEEHKSLLEWVGGAFDSEHFDLADINQRLKQLK